MRKAGVLLATLAVVVTAGAHAEPSAPFRTEIDPYRTQAPTPVRTAVSGELRVLYVLATWGPASFTHAEAEQVAAQTDEFFRASSSGRLAMPSSVAGPVRLPRAAFDSCDATALRNVAPASMFAGYDRVVFVTPLVASCHFAGEANPTEVLLNGALYMPLAAHELGHTLGLGHASRWDCTGSSCTVDEYGSSFSVMGGGGGDLNAYEKAKLEWLTGVVRPQGSATHEIGPVEGSTALPQALVVTTARSEFWVESRREVTPSFRGASRQPPGVAVVAGPFAGALEPLYPRDNLLLPNVADGASDTYAAGESFVQPGVFRVSVERHAPESASLDFRWLDRTRPGPPRTRVLVLRRGRLTLLWDPAPERGSGVATYTVLVDGRVVRTLDGEIPFLNSRIMLSLRRGLRRVGVVATDRAGNRGATSSVQVRVR
jgi:hypothetical protein